jgi:lipopolysaccharide heptosyltransferase I
VKILIVKLGSIGDVVHTLPSLVAIKKKFQEARISWIVEEKASEILRGNMLLSDLIVINTVEMRRFKDFSSLRGILQLRKIEPDVALDFQGLLKSALIARLSGAKRRYGFSKNALREPESCFFLTDLIEIPNEKIHVIQKNLLLAEKALGVTAPDVFEFPIETDQSHQREAEEIIERIGGNFAILNPAGGWKTKLWDAKKFGVLADRLWEEFNLRSVVTTAKKENSLAHQVLQGSKTKMIVLANPSLKGFYELAKRARIYVGGDTGPTHLAVAARTPVVGIFGPTEWWHNGSFRSEDVCVERTDINCRVNCHRRVCDNWICMNISVETVFEAVRKRLNIAEESRLE